MGECLLHRLEEAGMRQLSVDDLARLRNQYEPPCISLYQPTHRHHPDNQQDPIRYRNLRSQLESTLRQKYTARESRALLGKYRSLERDSNFWNHRTEGLAILSSPQVFDVFELQRPVPELLVVAQNFYTKPLLRILQSADRYQVLCLGRHSVALFEGNRDAIDPVDLDDVLGPLREAVALDRERPGVAARASPGGGGTVHYATGQKSQEVELEQQRFFRAVDRAILEHHSRRSSLPLMLAALPEYHATFRALSHNPFLLADGIQTNPDALDPDHLRALAWQKIEPHYLQRLERLLDQYQTAKTRELASDEAQQVAAATLAGRVGTLLVEADRQLAGRIDDSTGRIEPGAACDPDIGDVFNDLAEVVVRMKGEVVVVPADRMPSSTGIAAIYRF
jgi:Bacterial archaeo-eukaryotic release factor family 3